MSKINQFASYLRKNKIVLVLMAAVAAIAVAALMTVALNSDEYAYVEELVRPVDGQGQKMYELELVGDGIDENVVVYVDSKKQTKKELEELFYGAEKIMSMRFLDENISMDSIEKPLNLISTIPEYNMQVEWHIQDMEAIDYLGNIYQGTENKNVAVEATLIYEGRVADGVENQREYMYTLNIMPYSEEQLKNISIDQFIMDADKNSENMDRIILPKEYEGKQIKYRIRKGDNLYKILLIIPVIVTAAIVELRTKKSNQKKKLREQMMLEYPEIISKLSLLTASGMTPYNALKRIASDGKGEAYKRLAVVVGNIQAGASERAQYATFGQIFELYCYGKLGSMLEQNVVRGNEKFREMLRDECADALEERKARARKAGEQAGTKMLFPMMLMLIVVMAIIMVPAFMSM